MFYYLKGVVTLISEGYIVLEVNNIGYKILVSHCEQFTIGVPETIYVHQVIREDDQFLVGFVALVERELFDKLIQVKGIGPKTAINALSSTTPENLHLAIQTSDVMFLKKLPGIGPKAAAQIILDLKGQLRDVESSNSKSPLSPIQQDLKEALRNFGYKTSEIDRVLPLVDNTLTLEEMVKSALTYLRK